MSIGRKVIGDDTTVKSVPPKSETPLTVKLHLTILMQMTVAADCYRKIVHHHRWIQWSGIILALLLIVPAFLSIIQQQTEVRKCDVIRVLNSPSTRYHAYWKYCPSDAFWTCSCGPFHCTHKCEKVQLKLTMECLFIYYDYKSHNCKALYIFKTILPSHNSIKLKYNIMYRTYNCILSLKTLQ